MEQRHELSESSVENSDRDEISFDRKLYKIRVQECYGGRPMSCP